MAAPIHGVLPAAVRAISRSEAPTQAKVAGEAPGASFIDILREQVARVNTDQVRADAAGADLVTGRSGDIHGTVIALERADLSFRLLTRVRNKALDAYQEVMRMNL